MSLSVDATNALYLIKNHGGYFTIFWRYQSPDRINYADGSELPAYWWWSVINKELIKHGIKGEWIRTGLDEITATYTYCPYFGDSCSIETRIYYGATYKIDVRSRYPVIEGGEYHTLKIEGDILEPYDPDKHKLIDRAFSVYMPSEYVEYRTLESEYLDIEAVDTSDYGVTVKYSLTNYALELIS